MGFKLKRNETLECGIRRIANKQLCSIASHLAEARADRLSDAVHETRTSVKKLRALLRLVRESFDERSFCRDDGLLRDIAKPLSDFRDVEIQIRTLGSLRRQAADYGTDADLRAFAALRAILLARRKKLVREAHRRESASLSKAALAKEQIAAWPVKKIRRACLADAAADSLKRCRSALDRARNKRSVKCFHKWRARSKELWYQLAVLKRFLPKSARKLANDLESIGDHLGNDHDLALLEASIESVRLPGPRAGKLRKLIRSRHRQLRRCALDLAPRIQRRKPSWLARKIRRGK